MMPLLVSLTQWGDKWVFGEGREPVIFLDREHGEPISRIQVYSAKGEVLRYANNYRGIGDFFQTWPERPGNRPCQPQQYFRGTIVRQLSR